ncbi:MAG: secretin N-terminal domain-containing protein [Gammaproteobacteria bacterium]|nr:MAG: secretin N-terminal domain-containing protein [Gammaproteobacteria bacterium]
MNIGPHRLLTSCLLLLLMLASHAVYAGPTNLEVIYLKHRPAREIIPLIKPFVGPGGAVSGTGFKLIVRATPEYMRQVKNILTEIDAGLNNLIIQVRQGQQRNDIREATEVSGNIRSGDAEISVPGSGGGGVTISGGSSDSTGRIKLRRTHDRGNSQANQKIRVLEGQPAFIQVGVSVPLAQSTTTTGPGGTVVQQSIQYKDVTSGFDVIARVNNDIVTLEISPRNETLSRRGGGAINIRRAQTVVSGKLGEWIDIGGSSTNRRSNTSGYTYSTQSRSKRNSSIFLKVEIDKN